MGDVPTKEQNPDIKIKSVFCFTIAPDMKRKGIATQLLEHVLHEAKLEGYDFIEAYPNKEVNDESINFAGAVSLYEKCGFTVYCDTEDKYVMRKQCTDIR